MFKKLLTLAAVAAVGVAANAEIVVDYEYDWGKASGWNRYVMGYIPEIKDEALWAQWPNYVYKSVDDLGAGLDYEIVTINGADNYKVPCTDEAGGATEDGLRDEWGIQFHVLNQEVATEPGQMYTITIVAKSSKDGCNLGLPFSWGWGNGESLSGSVTLGTEYQEISFDYPTECLGSSCWCVAQLYSGDKTDDNGKPTQIWIQSVKITHDAKPKAPETWDDLLVNGDAEGEYGDRPCAYSKENAGEPGPAAIELQGDNHVFVVHAGDCVSLNDDGTFADASAWDNQFWIQAPREFKQGESFRVSFRYKASQAANTNTQCHKETAGDYLHWSAIGDVAFTTEWQEITKVVNVDGSMGGMWSIAFNLNAEVKTATDFYFDDLKWEVLRLEEGYFVAGDFNDWNYGEALKFDFDEDAGVYTKVVGNTEVPASEIKISTRKGQDAAFHSNALSVAAGDGIIEDAPCDFTVGNGKKIQLPYADSWIIEIDEEYGQITFYINEDDAVESVSVDNAAPVYYNLQGVKVNAPVKGQVVIVKRGNKVSKEIAR